MELICGKQIRGTWGGESRPDSDIPTYVDLFLSQKLQLGEFITHTYELDRINQALDDLESGDVARALIDMGSEDTRGRE